MRVTMQPNALTSFLTKSSTHNKDRLRIDSGRRTLIKTQSGSYGDISITLVLFQLNKVPSLELEHFKEDTGGSAARTPGNQLVIAEFLGFILVVVSIIRLHVALQHTQNANGMFMPFGIVR